MEKVVTDFASWRGGCPTLCDNLTTLRITLAIRISGPTQGLLGARTRCEPSAFSGPGQLKVWAGVSDNY